MPNIRTTHVSLLVDRETDQSLEVSEIVTLANVLFSVDNQVSEIYLLANFELSYPWTDIFDQTDAFAHQVFQYFTDFTEIIQPVDMTFVPDTVIDLSYPAGYPLHNLQNAWVAGSQWGMVDGFIRHTVNAAGRHALIWYEPGVFANVVATLKVKFSGADIKRPGILLRASGDATNETGYCFRADRAGAQISILKLLEGGYRFLATQAYTFTGNVWYNIKAECTEPTVRMKLWLEGTEEPVAWTLSTTDTCVNSVMTGNTVPQGFASASTVFNPTYAAWKAMMLPQHLSGQQLRLVLHLVNCSMNGRLI